MRRVFFFQAGLSVRSPNQYLLAGIHQWDCWCLLPKQEFNKQVQPLRTWLCGLIWYDQQRPGNRSSRLQLQLSAAHRVLSNSQRLKGLWKWFHSIPSACVFIIQNQQWWQPSTCFSFSIAVSSTIPYSSSAILRSINSNYPSLLERVIKCGNWKWKHSECTLMWMCCTTVNNRASIYILYNV